MNSNEASAAQQPSGRDDAVIDVFCQRYHAHYFGLEIGAVIFRPKYNGAGDVGNYFEPYDPATQLEARCKMFSLVASKQEEFIKKIDDIEKTLPKSGSHHTNKGIISDVWNELAKGNFLSAQQYQQGLKGLKKAGFPTEYLKS